MTQHHDVFVGRGGAGNALAAPDRPPAPGLCRALPPDAQRDELDRSVREAVDKGLRVLERAHHRRDKSGHR